MMNFRRGVAKVAVGDVDRDALLPFGPQAVGEQGEVGVVLAPGPAGPLDRSELILKDRLGVVQQAPDQGALAIGRPIPRWPAAGCPWAGPPPRSPLRPWM